MCNFLPATLVLGLFPCQITLTTIADLRQWVDNIIGETSLVFITHLDLI